MTSYGDIIKQGRKEEEVVDTESINTVKEEVGKKVSTESSKTVKDETGKKASTKSGKTVKKEVGKKVNTKSGKTVNNADSPSGKDSQDSKKDIDDSPVNITIKVPRNLRQYWASQCKLQGITMTQVLVEALTERFGKP